MQLTQPTTTDSRRHSIKYAMSCDRLRQLHNQLHGNALSVVTSSPGFFEEPYCTKSAAQTASFNDDFKTSAPPSAPRAVALFRLK